jgi:hypothetical protein
MPVEIRVLNAHDSLQRHENVIRQTERLGFRLLSIATGAASSQRANLATFAHATGPPPAEISLQTVAGNLSERQQQDQLNTAGMQVVCYGSLFVNGAQENIAALR